MSLDDRPTAPAVPDLKGFDARLRAEAARLAKQRAAA